MTVQEDRDRAASRNTVALLASRVAISSLGWAGSIVIARQLSPEAFGQYSFIFGLLGLLGIVTDLGVGRVVLARLVNDRDVEVPLVASAFIALRVLLGLVGYVFAMGYVLLLGYPPEVVRATALAGLVVVVATPSHALTMLFQARLKMTVVAAAEALGQVVQLGLTLVVALVAPTLLIFVLPVIANELFKIFVKLRGVSRGDTGPRPARQVQLWRWRGMLIDAVPLTIGTALTTLLYKVDILLLSRLDTFEAVGLYSVGYKFADVLALTTTAVLAPALTLQMGLWPTQVQAFRQRTRDTALVVALLGCVALAGFWASAGPLITTLYGDRFGVATSSSRLLVAGAALAMLTQVGFNVLIATGRQRVYPFVGLVGLGLNVGLNLVLIPRMSFDGAAVATLVTEGAVFVVMWGLVRRSLSVRGLLPGGRLCVLAAATGAVVLASEALDDLVPWPVVAACAGLATLIVGWLLDLPGTRSTMRGVPGAARRLARL